jgi:hypothetical protein
MEYNQTNTWNFSRLTSLETQLHANWCKSQIKPNSLIVLLGYLTNLLENLKPMIEYPGSTLIKEILKQSVQLRSSLSSLSSRSSGSLKSHEIKQQLHTFIGLRILFVFLSSICPGEFHVILKLHPRFPANWAFGEFLGLLKTKSRKTYHKTPHKTPHKK